ncbi:uncharacterized protein V6R79_025403 [Siganus canaliculatus]
MKEKCSYQRRMFSQPPGYIAPPPYNSPLKNSPVFNPSESTLEQEGKRQTYWSQSTVGKQEVPVEHRKVEQESVKSLYLNQHSFPELEGLKHRKQSVSPTSTQRPQTQQEQPQEQTQEQPQALKAVEIKKISEDSSSKVIEGRKFRLNKKTGGMTIFCLVSRIAGTTETPSLPLWTNIQNTESGGVCKGLSDSGGVDPRGKLADEVDFRASAITEQPNTSEERKRIDEQRETPAAVDSEKQEVNLSSKAETGFVSTEKVSANEPESMSGKQAAPSAQPVPFKYPLWREPSFTSKAETENSSTCLKTSSDEGESVAAVDIEVKKPDDKEDAESDDSKGLLVIDTTCVVVKMELIPPPKKEHVHYVESTPQAEPSPLDNEPAASSECVQSHSPANQEGTSGESTETDPSNTTEKSEAELDLSERDQSLPCMSSLPERETLEERAARILGIPLNDCITESQTEEATCVENQYLEPSQIKDNNTEEPEGQVPEDATDGQQSQDQVDVNQTEDSAALQESDDGRDLAAAEGGEDCAGLKMDSAASAECQITEDLGFKSSSEEGTVEENQKENDSLIQDPPQCFIPHSDQSHSMPPLSLDSEAPTHAPPLMLSSSINDDPVSNTEKDPDPDSPEGPASVFSSLPQTQLQQLPESADLSSSSTPHTDHSPSPPPPPDLTDPTAEASSGLELRGDESEALQRINQEEAGNLDGLDPVLAEESVSQPREECGTESDITEEQQMEAADGENVVDQALNISPKNSTESNVAHVQEEAVVCGTGEEQCKVNQDPAEQEQTLEISAEDATEQQQQLGNEETEEEPPKEAGIEQVAELDQTQDSETETESQTPSENTAGNDQDEDLSSPGDVCESETDKDPAGPTEHTTSKDDVSDSPTPLDIPALQDVRAVTEVSRSAPASPSDPDCEPPLDELPSPPPPPSYGSDTELDMDSCPVNDAAIPQTVPPPLPLDTSPASPPVLQSTTVELQQTDEGVYPSPEEPQYPKSLWDAVNRIRKHTAPDSENEEDELGEPWDPESVVEDFRSRDVIGDINFEKLVFAEVGHQEVATKGSYEQVETGQIQQQLSGHVEEDTMSCGSASSHGSGDTVIVADEDEAEETPPGAGKENESEHSEESQTVEGGRCCSGEAKYERKEEDGGQRSLGEAMDSTTMEVEMVEEKEEEQEVFLPSDDEVNLYNN